ncbi:hypothetical protein FB446DRAFT_794767 [Lentinula raphanica]|nr:hypothetical protein FB446DRAFT_794767 [Lentinula raphanica]
MTTPRSHFRDPSWVITTICNREVNIDTGDREIPSSSPRRTPSQPNPIHLGDEDEESDIDISDLCATDRIQPSDSSHDDYTDLEFIESVAEFSSSRSSSTGEAQGDRETIPSECTDGFEIDELDSDQYRLNSPLITFGNCDLCGSASSITVIIWTENNKPAHSIAIELTRNPGPYISLAMVSDNLRGLGLTKNGLQLQRFMRDKGWRLIGWNTLFPIYETKLVALKSVEVVEVKDWDLQLDHMYD